MSMRKEKFSRNVMDAYKLVERQMFVPTISTEMKIDDNLPIGFGQTITQTKIVLSMLNECKIEKTHKVLEIGTGSGYQTFLLSVLGKEIYTVELIQELSIEAERRMEALRRENIHYLIADGNYGWSENAPYDRIIVCAGCRSVPQALFQQLDVSGIMIIPVGEKKVQKLMRYSKLEEGCIRQEILYDVSFVEFKGENGWKRNKSEFY